MTLATRMVRDPFLTDFPVMSELLGRGLGNGSREGFVPLLDIHETETEYLVHVDLPGMKREDVAIELEDQVLTISGMRAPFGSGETQRTERPSGPFSRSLTVPKGVDVDKIEAEYTDGVLELRIPKPAEQQPKKIAITGSSGNSKKK